MGAWMLDAMVTRIAVLAVALIAGGCASNSVRNPLSLLSRTQESDPQKETAKVDEGKPTPFERTRQAESTNKATPSDENSVKLADGEAAKQATSITHDAETLKLIQAELADATPEQQQQLFEELKGVEPDMVRTVLQVRRMARQMKSQNGEPGVIEQAGGRSPSAGVVTADQSSAPGVKRQPAGLGTTSPWGAPDPRRSAASSDESAASNASPAGNAGQVHQVRRQASDIGDSQMPAVPSRNDIAAPPGTSTTESRGFGHVSPVTLQSPVDWDAANLPTDPSVAQLATAIRNSEAAAQGATEPSRLLSTVNAPNLQSPDSTLSAGLRQTPNDSGQLEQLISQFETVVAGLSPTGSEEEQRQYVEQHVQLRMLYLVSGQQERALQPIPAIDPADQEFWQQIFWAVSTYFDPEASLDGAHRATQTIAQLRAAILRLKEEARLELRNVSFCHKILSYGNYQRLERDEFSPGQPVMLYA